jgi:hypothetical protein
MTPVREDLIQWEECDALVSMANGAVVHVKHCGSVKICLNDINHPRNSKFVQIEKVLYVPGLNRRLLSVVQWNDAGGEILFLRNHCRIILTDDITDTSYSIDVDSPFAADMPFTGNAEPQPADGRVQCPLRVYHPDQPVKVGRFRVLFCPVLAMIGPRTLTE